MKVGPRVWQGISQPDDIWVLGFLRFDEALRASCSRKCLESFHGRVYPSCQPDWIIPLVARVPGIRFRVRSSISLFGRNQGQQKFLEPLTFCNSEIVQLNPHSISTHNADHRPNSDNRLHSRREVQRDLHWRTRRQHPARLDQHTAQADVNRLAFQFLRSELEFYFGLERNTPGPAAPI